MEDLNMDMGTNLFEQCPILLSALSSDRLDKDNDNRVNIIPATNIAFEEAELTVQVGKGLVLEVIATPKISGCPSIAWASSNPSVVSIDDDLSGSSLDNSANALIIAKGIGTATITAYSSDINKSCTCTINVVATVETPAEEETVTYTVTVANTGEATYDNFVSILNSDGQAQSTFVPGDVVSLQVVFNPENQEVLTIADAADTDAVVLETAQSSETGATYTFVMPERNVTINYAVVANSVGE